MPRCHLTYYRPRLCPMTKRPFIPARVVDHGPGRIRFWNPAPGPVRVLVQKTHPSRARHRLPRFLLALVAVSSLCDCTMHNVATLLRDFYPISKRNCLHSRYLFYFQFSEVKHKYIRFLQCQWGTKWCLRCSVCSSEMR